MITYQMLSKITGQDLKTVKRVSRDVLGGCHKATPETVDYIISMLIEEAKKNESNKNGMGKR